MGKHLSMILKFLHQQSKEGLNKLPFFPYFFFGCRKTILMEDDLNGRRTQQKETSLDDNLDERRHQWKTKSIEYNLNGG